VLRQIQDYISLKVKGKTYAVKAGELYTLRVEPDRDLEKGEPTIKNAYEILHIDEFDNAIIRNLRLSGEELEEFNERVLTR
jgi:hypothetical protein